MGAKSAIVGLWMGSGSSQEAEASARKKKLNDDLNRIKDAETIPLWIKGRSTLNAWDQYAMDARLSGTLQELIEEVAAEFGVAKEFTKDVEMHLSGYQLKPVTKTVRDFTELCPDTEIEVHGIEKAKEARKQRAASVDVHKAATTTCFNSDDLDELKLVVEFAPERINEANSRGETPLHKAAQYGQAPAVSLLIWAGANVNAMTPPQKAVRTRSKDRSYSNINGENELTFSYSKQDKKGETPLRFAKNRQAIGGSNLYNGKQISQLLLAARGHY